MTSVDILETKEFTTNMRKLSESVWGDVRRRADGTSTRKEDDKEKLYKYLNNTYETLLGDKIEISDEWIAIPLFKYDGAYSLLEIRGTGDNKKLRISIKYWDTVYLDFVKEMKQFYNIDFEDIRNNWTYMNINPKNGEEIDYDFITNLIDYVIENVKVTNRKRSFLMILLKRKGINESVWGDVRRRAEGQSERKENIIDDFNRDEMYDYIYSIYEQDSKYNILPLKSETTDNNTKYFSIPVFMYGNAAYRLAVKYEKDKLAAIILLANEYDCEGFYGTLTNKFIVKKSNGGALEIKSKESKIYNKLIIEIIDTINEGIEQAKESGIHDRLEPIMIKKENR